MLSWSNGSSGLNSADGLPTLTFPADVLFEVPVPVEELNFRKSFKSVIFKLDVAVTFSWTFSAGRPSAASGSEEAALSD